ncbi:GntR family transcriptional regulator [Micromonospora orduensis]|uniref:GntR family transcriptional regulator n=1 Tax=Micromonospora orduensis TaxID=1420891 RepID=A0A5C4QXU3_9ACTN|nr:GntR family transcriptional regulator [Micromonospora orduensis]TNH30887.1 GntR family transcriptional regulator [Micromonospora orduensis]
MSIATESGRTDVPLGRLLFDRLREQLVEGTYPPGSRVPIDAIKEEFGVSKQPVMEALRRLATMGLVEIVPQSGCVVRQYTQQEARDFFGVFGSFEGDIAAAAARRHTPEELVELDHAFELLHQAEHTPEVAQRSRDYFQYNAGFHRVIHRMARSPLIADLSQRMWVLSDFLMYGFAGAAPIAGAVDARNHDHDLIRTAIRDRNDTVARAAMDHHIRSITRLFAD